MYSTMGQWFIAHQDNRDDLRASMGIYSQGRCYLWQIIKVIRYLSSLEVSSLPVLFDNLRHGCSFGRQGRY
jgi:hypothetical protein